LSSTANKGLCLNFQTEGAENLETKPLPSTYFAKR